MTGCSAQRCLSLPQLELPIDVECRDKVAVRMAMHANGTVFMDLPAKQTGFSMSVAHTYPATERARATETEDVGGAGRGA